MKQIFTSHDLLTVVTELQKMGLEGAYLQNCYDVTSRSIILRFSGHLENNTEPVIPPSSEPSSENSDKPTDALSDALSDEPSDEPSDESSETPEKSTRQKIHLLIESVV